MIDKPVLDQINLVVDDMDATLAFYRRLGVDVPAAHSDPSFGAHTSAQFPNGMDLDFDDKQLAALYSAGWRAPGAEPPRAVMTFRVGTRDAVDALFADLTGAGYPGVQVPFDAFWGARYAIVADPDGNHVGFMSPSEDSHRQWPPTQSPDA